nr:immunoglobulin heavy chain junction region [Macaca mulatta]
CSVGSGWSSLDVW